MALRLTGEGCQVTTSVLGAFKGKEGRAADNPPTAPFTDEENKAQDSDVAPLRSHSKWSRLDPKLL